MKAKEIRQTSKEELDKKIFEFKKEMIKLNAQVATGTPPKNPNQIKEIKKTIARILTVQGESKKHE